MTEKDRAKQEAALLESLLQGLERESQRLIETWLKEDKFNSKGAF